MQKKDNTKHEKLKVRTVILLSVLTTIVFGQNFQNIRGRVFEKNTQTPIPFAHVWTSINGNTAGSITDSLGNFVIGKVPVGRCEVYASSVDYEDFVATNVLVYSGRETVLEIAMIERVFSLDELVVRPSVDKDLPLSRMATASVRMFSTEEANRYAGSWGDPARMAANFAGVSAANDSRNDIIIRGNSPLGLLYRLDGFDIPNPNHFVVRGSTGGAISMINNNQLANSDFYTGAFPAEFGNALSGVFDLKMRNGNNRKQEFLASIGFNGLEFGAEGYFSKESDASYLVNARYSFLEAMVAMGLSFGSIAEDIIPKYRDLCAKINIPLKTGNFSFVTLIGANSAESEDDMNDANKWMPEDIGTYYIEKDRLLFFGANYTRRFNVNTRLENRLSYQHAVSKENNESITYRNIRRWKTYSEATGEGRTTWLSSVYHRVNARNFLEAGAGVDLFMTKIQEKKYDMDEKPTLLHDIDKSSLLIKMYGQWRYRINDVLTVTPGLYNHYYLLTNNYSIEPRIGMSWKTSLNTTLNFSTGLYSQLQPRIICFYQDNDGQYPNKSLKFTKSRQTVAGFNWKFAKSFRLKNEVYYQYLYDAPVIEDFPQESLLNFGDDNNWDYAFVNKGTGRNYGVELTLEKFLTNNYYFLATVSLYQSKYKGYDKIERDTKYNGNYAMNFLGGYEWKVGKNNLLSANVKLSRLGGKRHIPATFVTDSAGTSVKYDYENAYSSQYPAYFRFDLNINMKMNFNRWSLEFFAELANLTNHKNVWTQYYDLKNQKEVFIYHYGFMPIGGLKAYF